VSFVVVAILLQHNPSF